MTIHELVQRLNELAEEFGEDTEVRLAFQPSWPLEYSVGLVEPTHDTEDEDIEGEPVVYIAEGGQLGYLNGLAVEALGWGRL